MKKIVILFSMAGLLCGCSLLHIPVTTPQSQSSSNYSKEYYRNKILGEEYLKIQQGKEKIQPRKTISEKIGGWIAGLTATGIIGLIVLWFFIPSLAISIVFGIANKFKRAFIETVIAIKKSQAANENAKLEQALRDGQSLETKKLVTEYKNQV